MNNTAKYVNIPMNAHKKHKKGSAHKALNTFIAMNIAIEASKHLKGKKSLYLSAIRFLA